MERSPNIIRAVWRPEDSALVERLENEIVLERLWRFQAGNTAPPPHPRAAGMISLVRRTPGGETAVAEALTGRFEAVFARLLPGHLGGQAPELLHHVALYYGRLADALAVTSPDSSIFARTRSLAAWIALGEEKTYLRTLAAAIAGDAISLADVERAAESAATEPIDDLARVAREGANEQTTKSRLAIAALARIDDASRVAAASPSNAKNLARRAERARAAAVEDALAPIEQALSEATVRGDVQVRAPDLFQRVAGIWSWAGEDEAVEIFAIEQVTPIAWEIQRDSRWTELARLLAPVLPLSESLARRIDADPTRIAYAAGCAQIFVFRVEMARELERRLALGERAVKLCPSHRNGRLVLASALCDQAVRLVSIYGVGAPKATVDAAEAIVARAEKLFPELKKLEDTKKQIDVAKSMLGSARK